ncbi:hypothetical protein [Streptomyces orinoci]|uniref:hypothetical protein n=1 Tax=Streptomyces orinoci TaxID=67339 RepID=UPI003BAB6CDE
MTTPAESLLRRMVEIPSPSGREGELAAFLAQELPRWGFAAGIDEAGKTHPLPHLPPPVPGERRRTALPLPHARQPHPPPGRVAGDVILGHTLEDQRHAG